MHLPVRQLLAGDDASRRRIGLRLEQVLPPNAVSVSAVFDPEGRGDVFAEHHVELEAQALMRSLGQDAADARDEGHAFIAFFSHVRCFRCRLGRTVVKNGAGLTILAVKP